jgi:hypothetical protein
MNKLFSLLLCFALTAGICVASPGQKQHPTEIFQIEFAASSAVSSGDGVYVEWRVANDFYNFGFEVFRVEGKRLVRVNDEIIAGAAVLTIKSAQSEAAHSYRYFDRDGAAGNEYVIEAVNVNNERRQSEKIRAEFGYLKERLVFENSKTLAEAGRDAENGNIFRDFPDIPLTKEFAALQQDAPQNAQTQRWVAAQSGAKIAVKRDGLYRVARAQLAATNFDLNAPLANWQLYADGIEQPIIIGANGDYIEFYGRGIDTVYSDNRIYYLVVGSAPGKRIQLNKRSLNPTRVAAPNFDNILDVKVRNTYSAVILNGEAENFFGDVIINSFITIINFQLKGIDQSAAQASIDLQIQGLTLSAHNIKVYLNNTEIGTVSGNGREIMTAQFSVPTSLLIEGNNRLGFQAQTSGDSSFFDTAKIGYVRTFAADANRLTFTTKTARATKLTNFTAPNVRVFDITNPNETVQIYAENIGNGEIFIGANRPKLMYAVADGAAFAPASVASNLPSNLLDAASNKDLLIITHPNFFAQAESLAAYRAAQGLTVAIAKIEDVYDESSFGILSSEGIKTFVQATQPRYVLFIGDSTYDPRNYFGMASPNYFVPTKMFETLFGETYTDEFFTDFNDDKVGDIPIGRLPAIDAATAQTMVSKIASFESNVGAALMSRGATFVCDNTDGFNFCASVERLRNNLPASAPVDFIRRSDGSAATVRQQIINRINGGRFIVGYSGHGTLSAWSGEAIFASQYVPQLNNTAYNLFLPMNCLNGAFGEPFSSSLSETMVRAGNGGSIAAWSSSGLTFPDTQEQMALRFFQSIGNGEFARLGDATKTARLATIDPDVRQTWILLGDPTLKIR